MLRFLLGIFIVLHGLVHLWFLLLSLNLVKITPGMAEIGWTGKSWFFSGFLGDPGARLMSGILFSLAALGLVISGFMFLFKADGWWQAMMGSAIFSAAIIFLAWDGSTRLLLEKGTIGFIISLGILFAMIFFRRTIFAF